MAQDILEELKARGLVQATTADQDLATLLDGDCVPFYAGYDPTASSLHVGSLVPTALLARLQAAGHKPIALVGGATGMIGDPSGKSNERELLDADTLQANLEGTRKQLEGFIDFGNAPNAALVVNNADWFEPIGFIQFLRDVGKHMTVNYMTAKDSVKTRLSDREQGISYTEFSYMLLQAYDFVHLAKEHHCRLQVGGSDQWGNITAGIELARKMGHTERLFGLTAPLLLDATGEKMGKTSTGTRIWLDPERTSPYAFFQYWRNTEDVDVDRFLRLFSWRPLDEIAGIVAKHAACPRKRLGQQALAEDMVTWVHGREATDRAINASEIMFGGTLETKSDADLESVLADVPSSEISRADLEVGAPLLDLLVSTALVKSKGEARRLAKNGGVYINNVRASDPGHTLTPEDLGTETMIVLRAGKTAYHIVRVQ